MKLFIYILFSIIWVLNDHFLKINFHNEFTGKLSDLLGLIVFPKFINLFINRVVYTTSKKYFFFFSYFLTYLIFFLINIDQNFNNKIYSFLFNNPNGISDITDLYSIPIAILVTYFLQKIPDFEKKNTVSETILVFISSLAFLATSYYPPTLRMIKFVQMEENLSLRVEEKTQLVWYIFDCDINQFDVNIYTQEDYENLTKKDLRYSVDTSEENLDKYSLKLEPFVISNFSEFNSLKEFYSNKIKAPQSIKIHLSKKDLNIQLDERIQKKIHFLDIYFPIPKSEYKLFLEASNKELECKNDLSEKQYDPQNARRRFIVIPYSKAINLNLL